MDARVRARVLLAEAAALGVTIADLVAAAADSLAVPPPGRVPTVAAYVEEVAPTFSAGTAATYRSYWRLAVARFGDRPVTTIGAGDCRAVVADAVVRPSVTAPGVTGAPRRRAVSPRCGRCSAGPNTTG